MKKHPLSSRSVPDSVKHRLRFSRETVKMLGTDLLAHAMSGCLTSTVTENPNSAKACP